MNKGAAFAFTLVAITAAMSPAGSATAVTTT